MGVERGRNMIINRSKTPNLAEEEKNKQKLYVTDAIKKSNSFMCVTVNNNEITLASVVNVGDIPKIYTALEKWVGESKTMKKKTEEQMEDFLGG